MHPTPQLEECITRMTPDQYARLLAFAGSLLAKSMVQGERDMAQRTAAVTELQRRIQYSFSENLWQRLRALTRKSAMEALNTVERAEYTALAEQREEADAERLQAALRRAQLRGVPPAQVLEACGIRTTGHG